MRSRLSDPSVTRCPPRRSTRPRRPTPNRRPRAGSRVGGRQASDTEAASAAPRWRSTAGQPGETFADGEAPRDALRPVDDAVEPGRPAGTADGRGGRSRRLGRRLGDQRRIGLHPPVARRGPARGNARPTRPRARHAGRPRQGLAIDLDRQLVQVTPGTPATLTLRVVNTGVLVEGCSAHIHGMPADWQVVDPPTFNLDVDSEQTVTIRITPPPRTHRTPSGRSALRVEVVSMVDRSIRAVADGALLIEPFYALDVKLTPDELEAKRQARGSIAIHNEGNGTEVLTFSGGGWRQPSAVHVQALRRGAGQAR